MSTLYTFRGKTMSIAAWARKYKMNRVTLWQRLKLGWSFNDAVRSKPYGGFRYWSSSFYTYNGETHSISGWARKYKIGRCTLWQRLSCGWSIEDALTTPPRTGKVITSKDQTMTIIQWEKKMGYCPNTIRRRLKAGWNPDDAVRCDPSEFNKRRRRGSLSALGIIVE